MLRQSRCRLGSSPKAQKPPRTQLRGSPWLQRKNLGHFNSCLPSATYGSKMGNLKVPKTGWWHCTTAKHQFTVANIIDLPGRLPAGSLRNQRTTRKRVRPTPTWNTIPHAKMPRLAHPSTVMVRLSGGPSRRDAIHDNKTTQNATFQGQSANITEIHGQAISSAGARILSEFVASFYQSKNFDGTANKTPFLGYATISTVSKYHGTKGEPCGTCPIPQAEPTQHSGATKRKLRRYLASDCH